MNRNDLYRSMDAIDDDILAEAASPERARNVSGKQYGWWIAAAACFCLIAGLGAWSLLGGRTAPADPNGSEAVVGKADLDEYSFILDGQQNARYQRFTYEDFIRFGLLPEGTPDSDVYTLAAMCVVSDDSLGATLGTITTASKPELVGKTARQYKTAFGDNVCIVESDGGYEFYYRKAILEQENAVAAYELLDRAFGHDDLGYTLFPDDYAGSYIEGDKLVLLLTNVSEETQKKYKTWAAQYAGVLVFKEAEYSYNTLNDTADAISKDLEDKGYTITEYCVSETTNRIIIRVANCTSAQTSELKRALEEAYHVPVSIETVQGMWTTVTP